MLRSSQPDLQRGDKPLVQCCFQEFHIVPHQDHCESNDDHRHDTNDGETKTTTYTLFHCFMAPEPFNIMGQHCEGGNARLPTARTSTRLRQLLQNGLQAEVILLQSRIQHFGKLRKVNFAPIPVSQLIQKDINIIAVECAKELRLELHRCLGKVAAVHSHIVAPTPNRRS